jgi:hypothetical protein
MKILISLSALALLAAGCATDAPTQVAQAECKLGPVVTTSATYGTKPLKPVSRLEQRYAEMQLANSQYRRQQYAQDGLFNNNIEEAMRDCDFATK